MTNDKLTAAIERLREVDAEAAEEVELAISDMADVVDSLTAWKQIATRLARTVVVYRTYSPN